MHRQPEVQRLRNPPSGYNRLLWRNQQLWWAACTLAKASKGAELLFSAPSEEAPWPTLAEGVLTQSSYLPIAREDQSFMPSRRDFLKYAGITTAAITSGCRGLSDAPAVSNPPNAGQPSGSLNSIEHIIFTMQENRSFDHYFGKMPEYRRQHNLPDDVDGLPASASNPARDDPTQLVHAYHLQTECHENLSPAWNESHRHWNRNNPTSDTGTLDGFVYVAANYSRANPDGNAVDFEGKRAMGYYDWNDIPYYYALASQFAMSDRNFCSVMSSTLANRMYLMAGSSFGRISPIYPTPAQVGANTIFDLCEKNGISWKIYVEGGFTYYAWFSGYNVHKGTSRIVPRGPVLHRCGKRRSAAGGIGGVRSTDGAGRAPKEQHPEGRCLYQEGH